MRKLQNNFDDLEHIEMIPQIVASMVSMIVGFHILDKLIDEIDLKIDTREYSERLSTVRGFN